MKRLLSDFIKSTIDNRGKNPTNYYEKEKYPVIDNVLIKNTLYPDMSLVNRFIDQETYNNFLRGYVHENMPLITLVGNGIGNVTLAPANNVAIIQNTIGLEVEDTLDEVFLYYLLLYMQPTIRNFNRGSGQPSVKKTDLLKMEVDVPAIDVQKRIRSVLMPIDKKIENNKAVNRNLHEVLCAVYEQKFSSVEKLKTLEEYPVKIYSGGTPSTSNAEYWNGSIPWLASGETAQRFVIETEKYITQEGVDNSSTKWASKYDVVTASAGQGHTRGQTSMLLLDTCVNQSVIVTHAEKQYMPFVYCNIYGRYEELRVLSDGTSTRGSLTTKIMAKLSMPDVTEQEILNFADFAWPIIDKIEKCQHEICRLSSLRDTLLTKLMSGELDVSDLDI